MSTIESLTGLSKEEYNRRASEHAKNDIFLWLLGGWVYNLFQGQIFSWSSVLLFLPGMVLITAVAIPTFFIELKKERSILATGNDASAKTWLLLAGWTVWYVVNLAYPVVLAILYVKGVESWIG